MLVDAAEDWAIEHGLGMIGVRTNLLRAEAQAFYECLGFKAIKNQKTYRKELGSLA